MNISGKLSGSRHPACLHPACPCQEMKISGTGTGARCPFHKTIFTEKFRYKASPFMKKEEKKSFDSILLIYKKR
ncbi:MAG: hypothetical protein F6K39_10615 [Okeania sp. SIO3B3]|nr:hypothetical protein [Okeania sp. SIO3B3]